MLIFHNICMMHHVLSSCYSDASLTGSSCLHKTWTLSLFEAAGIVSRRLSWCDHHTPQVIHQILHASSCLSELPFASLNPQDTACLMLTLYCTIWRDIFCRNLGPETATTFLSGSTLPLAQWRYKECAILIAIALACLVGACHYLHDLYVTSHLKSIWSILSTAM